MGRKILSMSLLTVGLVGLWMWVPRAQEAGPIAAEDVTYHNRVSRIIQQNCETCHRDGGIAPMSLASFQNAAAFAPLIRIKVGENRMPPWFANPKHGAFANDRSLSAKDKSDLLAWIENGTPEGDPEDAPDAKGWDAPGWLWGEPDAVVQIEDAIVIPAGGVVDYKYVYVKTDFAEDRWITRMEVQPTAPQVTHHVLVFMEGPDAERPQRMGGLDGYFAATVPGFTGNEYPEGAAKLLPAGAWLKFQLHYTPNGSDALDQTKVGLYFAEGPPDRVVETSSAVNSRFEIPPGAPNHDVLGRHTFNESGFLLSFFPHMHLRGKAFRYVAEYPDGREEILLDIPAYDFNWQMVYHLEEPLRIEPGMSITATGWFDNSAENPFNPDPSVPVHFGEQTFDEMMIGYFDWIPDRTVTQPAADAPDS
jgi:hypothetical protein